MSKNLLLFGLVLVLLVVVAFFMMNGGMASLGLSSKSVEINGTRITLDIADDPKEQEQGLSGRASMSDNRGMLFLFDKPDRYSFWMKDMKFPIDIIYINGNKVVTIFHEVPATIKEGEQTVQNLTVYTPSAAADKVLELNAGQAKKLKLKEGNEIKVDL